MLQLLRRIITLLQYPQIRKTAVHFFFILENPKENEVQITVCAF